MLNWDLLDKAESLLRSRAESQAKSIEKNTDVIDISEFSKDTGIGQDFQMPSLCTATKNAGYLDENARAPNPEQVPVERDSKGNSVSMKDQIYSRSSTVIVDRLVADAEKKSGNQKQPQTIGAQWFDMPAVEMTPELERDLKLIRMRHVLDPKRFYKRDSEILSGAAAEKTKKSKGTQQFFQIGTIVDSALDGVAGRIAKKQRKKTIVDELLADEESRQYFKKKFLQVQSSRRSNQHRNFKSKRTKR